MPGLRAPPGAAQAPARPSSAATSAKWHIAIPASSRCTDRIAAGPARPRWKTGRSGSFAMRHGWPFVAEGPSRTASRQGAQGPASSRLNAKSSSQARRRAEPAPVRKTASIEGGAGGGMADGRDGGEDLAVRQRDPVGEIAATVRAGQPAGAEPHRREGEHDPLEGEAEILARSRAVAHGAREEAGGAADDPVGAEAERRARAACARRSRGARSGRCLPKGTSCGPAISASTRERSSAASGRPSKVRQEYRAAIAVGRCRSRRAGGFREEGHRPVDVVGDHDVGEPRDRPAAGRRC